MTRQIFKPTPLEINKFKDIIGQPAILSTESADSYDAMFKQYMEALRPRDFLLQLMVKDLVHYEWVCLRLRRQQVLAIERRDRIAKELQDQRGKPAKQKRIAAAPADQEPLSLGPGIERSRGQSIEVITANSATPLDLALAHAMEDAIDYYEQLDRMEGVALAKRISTLEQMKHYNQALVDQEQRLRDRMFEMEIEAVQETIAEREEEQRQRAERERAELQKRGAV